MAVRFDALLSVAKLKELQLSSITIVKNDSELAGVERIIEQVSRRIEKHLDRRLIVRPHTVSIDRLHFESDPGYDSSSEDFHYSADVHQWPIVGVTYPTSGDASTPQIHYDRTSLLMDSTYTSLYRTTFLAGYRRSDQTSNAVLKAQSGATPLLDDLTDSMFDDLEELPGDIERVALALAIRDIAGISMGMVGRTRMRQDLKSVGVEIDGLVANFEDRMLETIDGHRLPVFF